MFLSRLTTVVNLWPSRADWTPLKDRMSHDFHLWGGRMRFFSFFFFLNWGESLRRARHFGNTPHSAPRQFQHAGNRSKYQWSKRIPGVPNKQLSWVFSVQEKLCKIRSHDGDGKRADATGDQVQCTFQDKTEADIQPHALTSALRWVKGERMKTSWINWKILHKKKSEGTFSKKSSKSRVFSPRASSVRSDWTHYELSLTNDGWTLARRWWWWGASKPCRKATNHSHTHAHQACARSVRSPLWTDTFQTPRKLFPIWPHPLQSLRGIHHSCRPPQKKKKM